MAEEAPICEHFQRAAELVAKRWNPQIVRSLLSGVDRFSDLKASIPQISDGLLSERLKELEAEGIVTRTVTPDTPVRIDVRPHRARPRPLERDGRAGGMGRALGGRTGLIPSLSRSRGPRSPAPRR